MPKSFYDIIELLDNFNIFTRNMLLLVDQASTNLDCLNLVYTESQKLRMCIPKRKFDVSYSHKKYELRQVDVFLNELFMRVKFVPEANFFIGPLSIWDIKWFIRQSVRSHSTSYLSGILNFLMDFVEEANASVQSISVTKNTAQIMLEII